MIDDGYPGLTADEEVAYCLFLDAHDPSELGKIIEENRMSADMARFVSDVITGKVKKRTGRPSDDLRNIQIFNRIDALLSKGFTLRGGRAKDGAATIVAAEFGLTGADPEEAAIKAYEKINKVQKESVMEVFSEAFDGKN